MAIGNDAMDNLHFLKEGLEMSLREEADRIFEEHKKRVIQEIEKMKPEIIARCIINLTKMTDMQMLGDRIVFTIRREQ